MDQQQQEEQHMCLLSRTQFYTKVMQVLQEHRIPFLVGGAYAVECYTGVHRHTKDLDIFVRKNDCHVALESLRDFGFQTRLTFPYWLGKVTNGDDANGICNVEDSWFADALMANIFGLDVLLLPVEEMIWTKAFIMEKERFDGADINHLFLKRGKAMDWDKLQQLFNGHWKLLYSHLIMFSFTYPSTYMDCVPAGLIAQLSKMVIAQEEAIRDSKLNDKLCNGTLLSRGQYLTDILKWNYDDARTHYMKTEDIMHWTGCIDDNAGIDHELKTQMTRRNST